LRNRISKVIPGQVRISEDKMSLNRSIDKKKHVGSDYESSDNEIKVIPITKRSIGKNPGSSPERRQIAIDYVDIRV